MSPGSGSRRCSRPMRRPGGLRGAPVVRTGGTIYPGLIELHNHLPYDVLPLWEVPRRYGNRGQWGSSNPDYRARVSGPMGVLGSVAGYIEAVVRYVEAKCLVAGVTTSQGVALYSNAGARRYFRGVVRNVEQPGVPDLPAASTRIADVEAEHAAAFRTGSRRAAACCCTSRRASTTSRAATSGPCGSTSGAGRSPTRSPASTVPGCAAATSRRCARARAR
jgi:hypothetical protein